MHCHSLCSLDPQVTVARHQPEICREHPQRAAMPVFAQAEIDDGGGWESRAALSLHVGVKLPAKVTAVNQPEAEGNPGAQALEDHLLAPQDRLHVREDERTARRQTECVGDSNLIHAFMIARHARSGYGAGSL